jgi:hypothetical protein
MTELATKVRGAFVWLALLTGACGVAFIFLLSRVDDRFDRADNSLRDVQMSVSAQSETLKAIDQRLSEVSKKLDSGASAVLPRK